MHRLDVSLLRQHGNRPADGIPAAAEPDDQLVFRRHQGLIRQFLALYVRLQFPVYGFKL